MNDITTDNSLIPKYGNLLRRVPKHVIANLDLAMTPSRNFQMQNINDMINEFKGEMPPNRMSHYILAYITSGTGTKVIGDFKFEIQEDMALIFPKSVVHSSENWSLATSGYMLSFSESLFESLQLPISFLEITNLFKRSAKPYHLLNREESLLVRQLFAEISRYYLGGNEIDSKLFILKLSELILHYKQFFGGGEILTVRNSMAFDRFVELVENNYQRNKDVVYYASKLSIHPNHLNRIVKQHSNLTTKEFIAQRLMQEVRYLLHLSSLSVKEISYLVGYNNVNYFCRHFKVIHKISALEYRKLSRKNAI